MFKGLDLDKEDNLNKLFVWVIQAIYKETSAVYYWPNFRDQVFLKDMGVDFMERLRMTKAVEFTREELTITTKLIEN